MIWVLMYFLPLLISLFLIHSNSNREEFFGEGAIKQLLISMRNFLPFLLCYMFLVSQTRNALLGVWITPLYLLHHFYWLHIIAVSQGKSFCAIGLSVINGLLLVSLQVNRSGGSWIFSWDSFIGLGIFLYAAIGHVISFICFLYITTKQTD